VQAEKERGRQVGIGEIHGAVHFDQLFELFRRSEPLHAALDVAADRVPEMPLRDCLAALGRPVGKAQAEVGMDDALAAARDLVEQPAEAVAETGGDAVRQEREQLQETDRQRDAETA
jgi:hypothetical protein